MTDINTFESWLKTILFIACAIVVAPFLIVAGTIYAVIIFIGYASHQLMERIKTV